MNFYSDWFANNRMDQNINFGVMTAIVKENWNEEKKGLVKVEFFFGEKGKSQTEWIRVASPYTTSKAGLFFFPEVGSEVIVAFVNGNQNEPVVIGSLWNEKKLLGDTFATEENKIKTIKTKAGHEILFDEEADKGQITIQTVGKLKINLADEKKILKITDDKGKSGITIDFENGTVKLEADKKLVLSAGGKEIVSLDDKSATVKADTVKLEAGQTLGLNGQSTNLEGNPLNLKSGSSLGVKADASLEVKANATLKLEASGITEVKGGMVKIN